MFTICVVSNGVCSLIKSYSLSVVCFVKLNFTNHMIPEVFEEVCIDKQSCLPSVSSISPFLLFLLPSPLSLPSFLLFLLLSPLSLPSFLLFLLPFPLSLLSLPSLLPSLSPCPARNAVVVLIGALVGYTLTTQVWFDHQVSLISTETFSLPPLRPPNVTIQSLKVREI